MTTHKAGDLMYILEIVQYYFILHVCLNKVAYYLKKNNEILTTETCFLPQWSLARQVLDVCIFGSHYK